MQRGISNSITNQSGYPSSGEMQANQGTLPAQRQQSAFAHQTNTGGLGQAVGGQQYKVNAQPMSSGVASYVGIPSNPAPNANLGAFQPPKQQLPGMQGQAPSFAMGGGGLPTAPQPQSQAVPNAPAPPQPYQPGIRPPQPTPAPQQMGGYDQMQGALQNGNGGQRPPQVPVEPSFRPDQTIYQTAHNYDIGGAYDVAARQQLGAQQEAQMRAQQAQSQLSGRGSDVALLNAGYNNQQAQAAYEQQRSQLQSQGMKDAFGMNLQQAQTLANTKMSLASLASQLGYNLSESDMNQLGSEVISKYGANATPGDLAATLQTAKTASTSFTPVQEHNLESAVYYGSPSSIVHVLAPATPEQVKAMLDAHPTWLAKIRAMLTPGTKEWHDSVHLGDEQNFVTMKNALNAAGYTV